MIKNPGFSAPEQGVTPSQRSPARMLIANLSMAFIALGSNRLRTLLTSLGIFIGVAAVISALTLTQGASAFVHNQIESLGTNSIVVSPGTARPGGVALGAGTLASLTSQDAQSLQKIAHVTGVSPIVTLGGVQALFGQQKWGTQVQGVNTAFEFIQNWQLANGHWFSENDDLNGEAVVVLGDTVVHNLFDTSGISPIGQNIQVHNQVFRVVGTLAPKGGILNQDDVIFIPFRTAITRLRNTTNVDQIQIQVDSVDNLEQAKREITIMMEQNHHLPVGTQDDFRITTSTQILQKSEQVSQVLTFLLVGIASISLTVGGIGIMNIMLVSVSERTQEIGLRMALGAKQSDIRNQFLTEALVLCLVGGIVGMIFGFLIGWITTIAIKIPFVVTPLSLIVPFAVSSAIGLLFGLYPAIRAARLDPIDALRIEE